MFQRHLATLAILSFSLTSCIEDNSDPVGLRLSQPTGGPVVKFDLDARPFPEIPFPNDLATRVDPTVPTNKRLNVSLVGGSIQEERVRRVLGQMTGFGTYSPITVPFSAPLDLNNLKTRHQEKTPDFSNDAVYLVNIEPKSPNFGKLELLDLGLGNFPVLHAEPDRLYDFDPRKQGTNLIFESMAETDDNGNGVLDPLEDTDDDGVWDKPNLLDQNEDPYTPGNTLEWYERESNTLILRPVQVLEANARYAVVLTDALVGEDQNSVDSPFEYVNHTRQTEVLSALRVALPKAMPSRFDSELKTVRFAWAFTTQDPTEDLRAVRAGLYGHGTFERLSQEFPADLNFVHNGKRDGAPLPMTFDFAPLSTLLVPLLPSLFGVASGSADIIAENLGFVDYLVSGAFLSPYFLADKDGLADGPGQNSNPQDDDEVFQLDPSTGEAFYKPGEVTFLCTVPKPTETIKPPFPTVIYSHAINSTRLEILLFGGALAKFGFATCAIDAVGHGVVIPPEYDALIDRAINNPALNIPNFAKMIGHHRARDLNNDGVADSGGMFFTSDILHTRDNFRQTTVDQMQFIRILRAFDGVHKFPAAVNEADPFVIAHRSIVADFDNDGDGQPEIAGDFNGDGIVDFGGDQAYVAFGTSLGGIQTTLIAASDPVIKAAVSNAGGGGITDIAARTTIRNARDGVTLRMIGPLLMGRLLADDTAQGRAELYFTLPSADKSEKVSIGIVPGFAEGDRIVFRNPNREKRSVVPIEDRQSTTYVRNGVFRVGIAADADGATMRRAKLGFDNRVPLVASLMQCPTKVRCGEQDCGGGQTCGPDGACMSVRACVENFDGATVTYADVSITDEDESAVYPAELKARTVQDATIYGDPLVIEVWSPEGVLKQTIDKFPENTVFENIYYPAGTPLAALAQGLGLKRQTPQFRKFIGVAQTLVEGADPSVVAPGFFLRPNSFPYEKAPFDVGSTNFMMAGTVGDQTVPISAGISIARTAGIIGIFEDDPRYGKPQNQFLIDNFVYEGINWLDRFPDFPDTLFDADDLDSGTFHDPNRAAVPPNKDAEKPLRATVETPYGISALRLPYLSTRGEHTFNAPLTGTNFDATTFMTNQVGWYLIHRGLLISDDPCLEANSLADCDFYDAATFAPPDLFRCSTGGCSKTLED